MADTAESPEAVALALLLRIASAESWSGTANAAAAWRKTRKEILDAYAECLDATKFPKARLSP